MEHGLESALFSRSLEDILDPDLFKDQVEKIPDSFQSVEHYFRSYVYPLLEETRAMLCSSIEIIFQAPFAEAVALDECKPYGSSLYDVKVDYWRNKYSNCCKEPYKTLPGDILILTDAKPETVADLLTVGRTWTFASVTKITEDGEDDEMEDGITSSYFKVKAAKGSALKDGMQGSLFAVFLLNITTNKRIWNALHIHRNLNVVKEVLCEDSVVEDCCSICSIMSNRVCNEEVLGSFLSQLNDSQRQAVLACLNKVHCNHKSTVELIWGPPGTGKTKTVSVLLYTLLRMNYRTLTCAPTNVAIVEVATRVSKLVKESDKTGSGSGPLFFPLGDMLLFGNKERLKVTSEIEEIYLDYRVKRLQECFGALTGWFYCFTSMINFLEGCVLDYHVYLENELSKEQACHVDEKKGKWSCSEADNMKGKHKSFIEYARERFPCVALPLRRCIYTLCTHIAKNYLLEHNFQNITSLVGLLHSFETSLFDNNVISEEVEELFSQEICDEDSAKSFRDTSLLLCSKRSQCLSILKTVLDSIGKLNLPSAMSKDRIVDFCLQTASLVFSTSSSSYKLHSMAMRPLKFPNLAKIKPLQILIIDEAAQLKESESAIPLQLPGIMHSILIGDECQLPATVKSNVSFEAGFGRSLFERLSSMGHSKQLLNIQYRMHPSISYFPNSRFYYNQILDAPGVEHQSYEKHYLPGPMFGPYSFINIFSGREEKDYDGHSLRNMVEVAIVVRLVRSLYKAWKDSKETLSIGVISPYASQIVAIQEKLGQKYENVKGFMVKVKTVDGFQGGEEDVIIISTVRSNSGGEIGFVSSAQRTNVALTRGRHCLWILGNARTLTRDETVWEALIYDAKERKCFFNADDDKELAKEILEAKKEFDQLDDLLKEDSVLFRSARWKVLFSDNFRRSFGKLSSVHKKKSVLNLLLKLSCGWRPKKRNVDLICESSSMILKYFKVEGLYIICSTDIVKEQRYIQVLKAWDLLPLEDLERLVKRLDCLFEKYSDDFITRCNEKYLEGDLEVPKNWSSSLDIVRYKVLGNNDSVSTTSDDVSDGKCYIENSKVSESLLLMKFYSLSAGVVNHLLSNRDGTELDLPFEVTDQELEIILFQRSTFILGRSGTGKTTVLTMKLYKKEQLIQLAAQGFDEVSGNSSNDFGGTNRSMDGVGESKRTVLRQLFVTVSPKLCCAVKHHVSQLKRFACGGKDSAGITSLDVDDFDDSQFKDIPDSLVDIPTKAYPLVITLQKFLMMLDGTVGNSFFLKFPDFWDLSRMEIGSSIALQSFIKPREVNYDKFCSTYWPHFNTKLTKKLDSSRVFTEIISHIKGGLRAGESSDGVLNREGYVLLSESRVSTLSTQNRESIYDIFQDYEKMKKEKGEFDMADLVIDLHRRLKSERYEGDMMDFVYIDEVQDLTMRQIALFKHISKNVAEGFVFSGDTAQTIARGIDFRFEDIRSLFYNEFVLGAKNKGDNVKKEKGQISKIFNLSQNFRTHDGVLRLAQSVIDLLYRFFPLFVDILSPESSLIYGEAPILLESGNEDNVITTMFRYSENVVGTLVGFGAEQVILVRDDAAKKEIIEYVGKQALVLTILECKGLEFQDVLLYNFFSSSPLKNQWRVVYEYMKEQGMLDATSPRSFPSFNQSKHNILCSELKQLYVAITRTRQRLWICENMEEFSKPIFDYWKKNCLVQGRKLDDSLVQTMQVASSPEEWKSKGYKLLRDHIYEMAIVCFERAGDTYGEKLAKAFELSANADRLHGSNPEMSSNVRRQAAEIFDSIGKAEKAAECFYILKEYERAGRIYLDKCGENALEKAGECFLLAGCYETAADAYARGKFFSKCLSVCAKGKLFDIGFQYIQYWTQHTNADNQMVNSREIEDIKQEFLESCAFHFHEARDMRTMMKFVRAFNSMDLKRKFLKSLDCLDELMQLEEELGNFIEAADIAKLRGEFLLEADLLGKGGKFKEAAAVVLWYVFANSLWSEGSKGWPLKQFGEKEKLLKKAKLFAENEFNKFYRLVSLEVDILSNEQSNLSLMKQHLSASQMHKSIRGEILCARKILDSHLKLNISKYGWEDQFVFDLMKYSEHQLSNNQASNETLVYFWNFWKDKIVNVLEYLGHAEKDDVNEYGRYGEFCLNYLGVWKQFNHQNARYLLLKSDAEWARELKFDRNRKLISVDVHQFVSAARSYWCSELLSVGKKVLDKLEAIYRYSTMNSLSVFCQCKSLTHIYEVAKFLLQSKFLNHRHPDRTLQTFAQLSKKDIFAYMFPLDWQESLRENMISLRGAEISKCLLEEVIFEISNSRSKLSYGEIGRVVLIILGSSRINKDLYAEILHGLEWNSAWMDLIKVLLQRIESPPGSEASNVGSIVVKLHLALQDTFNVNWRNVFDYITPDCFLYLIERHLILLSSIKGRFITTKYSFIEWLIFQEGNTGSTSGGVAIEHQTLEVMIGFIIDVVQQLIYNKKETMDWIRKSHGNVKFYSLMVLRLVVIVFLVFLNFKRCSELLCDFAGRPYITQQLPLELSDVFRRGRKYSFLNVNLLNVLAEAFKNIGNPLVIVNLGPNRANFACGAAISIDMKDKQCKEDIFGLLFPKILASQHNTEETGRNAAIPCKEAPSPNSCEQTKESEALSSSFDSLAVSTDELNPHQNESENLTEKQFWEVIEDLKDVYHCQRSIMSNASKIKVDVKKFSQLLTAALEGCPNKGPTDDEEKSLFGEAESMLDEIKQLSALLDESEPKTESKIPMIRELCKKLHSRKSTMESFLQQVSLSGSSSRVAENSQNEAKDSQATITGSQGNSSQETEKKAKGNSRPKKNKKSRGGGRKR